jgi:hypothetical protein
MNLFSNGYLGITVSVEHILQNRVPTEIQMRNVTRLGSITKAADSEVRSSGLSLNP